MIKLLFIFIPLTFFAQPDPNDYYHDRLEMIEKELKDKPFDHSLIWERMEKRISIMLHDYSGEVFYTRNDTVDCDFLHCDELFQEFLFFEYEYVRKGDFSLFEEGDFFLLRMKYFEILGHSYNAIQDALYLRNIASYSSFQNRGEYYYDQACWGLFELYVKEGDYFMANQTIDLILEKSKSTNTDVYFGHANHWFYKVRLMEYFGQTTEVVPFVRDLCLENFNYYFYRRLSEIEEYSGSKDEDPPHVDYCRPIRHLSFTYLQELVRYASLYEPEWQPHYESILNQLRDPVKNDMRSRLSDDSLLIILQKL